MKKQLLAIMIGGLFYQANAQIVITGVMGDPLGADAPKADINIDGLEQKGGYEYIQLLATKDIDFSKENFSLVIARNSEKRTVTAKGWAEGKSATYKFDLTSGKVKKGQFFYVGGAEKTIAGYSEVLKEKSTYIGEDADDKTNRAVWINAKDISKDGDGFGIAPNEKTGLMPNGFSNTYGIAVFVDTKVDANTVPIDAVFFGKSSSAHFMYNDKNGYLVPAKSDLYDAKNGEQKYFGQGSNTTLFATQKNTERSNFAVLGGIYNAKSMEWKQARKPIYKSLVPIGKTTIKDISLADIEKGSVTTLIN